MPLFDAYQPTAASAVPVDAEPAYPETGHTPPKGTLSASVMPWTKVTTNERRNCLTDKPWQAKVRECDRDGPGIVGAALDLPAATSMLLDLCIRRPAPGGKGYEIVRDDPLLTAVLGMWRGEHIDQKLLFSRLLRSLDAVGEAYMVLHNADHGGRLWWQLAQTTNCHDGKDGTTIIRTRPDAREGDTAFKRVPDRFVYHALVSDVEWEGEPWSHLRRGLDHLDQYKAAMRNIGRNLDSQLAMNGVLWAEAVSQKTSWPDHMKAWAHQAITSDDGIEAVMPFLMTTKSKPEWIDIGRGDHQDQLQVAEMFLKEFARSSDLPTVMLLEGPAQGKYFNSIVEQEWFADTNMQPRWQRAASTVTHTHLRPLLQSLPESFTSHLNIGELEVWADDTRIRGRTDNTKEICDAFDKGIASRQAVADAVGLDPGQIIDLPDGVSDYEAWLATRAPATLANRERGNPGVQGLIDEDPALVDRLEMGLPTIVPGVPEMPSPAELAAPPPLPPAVTATADPVDVADAAAGVANALHRGVPDYWDELVPTIR